MTKTLDKISKEFSDNATTTNNSSNSDDNANPKASTSVDVDFLISSSSSPSPGPGPESTSIPPSAPPDIHRSNSAVMESLDGSTPAQGDLCDHKKARSEGNNSPAQPGEVQKIWSFSAIQNRALRYPEGSSDGGCVYAPFMQSFSLLRSGRTPYHPGTSNGRIISGTARPQPHTTTASMLPRDSDRVTCWSAQPATQPGSPPPQSISVMHRPRALSHCLGKGGQMCPQPDGHMSNSTISTASSPPRNRGYYTLRNVNSTPVAPSSFGKCGEAKEVEGRPSPLPVTQPFHVVGAAAVGGVESSSNWLGSGSGSGEVVSVCSATAGRSANSSVLGREPSVAPNGMPDVQPTPTPPSVAVQVRVPEVSPGPSPTTECQNGCAAGQTVSGVTVDDMEKSQPSPSSPPTWFPSLPVPPPLETIPGRRPTEKNMSTTTTATAASSVSVVASSEEEGTPKKPRVALMVPSAGDFTSATVEERGRCHTSADTWDSVGSTSPFQSTSGTSVTLQAYRNRQAGNAAAHSSSTSLPAHHHHQQQHQARYTLGGASLRSLTDSSHGISASPVDPRLGGAGSQANRPTSSITAPQEAQVSEGRRNDGVGQQEEVVASSLLRSSHSLSQRPPQSRSPIPPFPQAQFRHFTVGTGHVNWEEGENRKRIVAAAVPQCVSLPSESCSGRVGTLSTISSSSTPPLYSDQKGVTSRAGEPSQSMAEEPQQHSVDGFSSMVPPPPTTAPASENPPSAAAPPSSSWGEDDEEGTETENTGTGTEEEESLSDSGAGGGGSSSERVCLRGPKGHRSRRQTTARGSIPSCVSLSERFGYVTTVPSLKRTGDLSATPPSCVISDPRQGSLDSEEKDVQGLPIPPPHEYYHTSLQPTLAAGGGAPPHNVILKTSSIPVVMTSSMSTISLEHIGETPRYTIVSPQIQSPQLSLLPPEKYAWPQGSDQEHSVLPHNNNNNGDRTASNSLFLAPFNRGPSISGSVLPATSFSVSPGAAAAAPTQVRQSSGTISVSSVAESVSTIASLSSRHDVPCVAGAGGALVPLPPPVPPLPPVPPPPPPLLPPAPASLQAGVTQPLALDGFVDVFQGDSTSSDSNRRGDASGGSFGRPLGHQAGSPKAYSSTASPLSRQYFLDSNSRSRTVQSSISVEENGSSLRSSTPHSPPLPQTGTATAFSMSTPQSREPVVGARKEEEQRLSSSVEIGQSAASVNNEEHESLCAREGADRQQGVDGHDVIDPRAAVLAEHSPPPPLSFPAPVRREYADAPVFATTITPPSAAAISSREDVIIPDETGKKGISTASGERHKPLRLVTSGAKGNAGAGSARHSSPPALRSPPPQGEKPSLILTEDPSGTHPSKPLDKNECSNSGGLLSSNLDVSAQSSLSPGSPVVSDCPTAVGGHHLALKCGRYFLKETCAAREERFYEAVRPYQEQLLAVAARMPPAALAAYSQATGWVGKEEAPLSQEQPLKDGGSTLASPPPLPPSTQVDAGKGCPQPGGAGQPHAAATSSSSKAAAPDTNPIRELSVFDEAIGSEHWWKLNDKSTFQPYVAAFAAQKEKKYRSRSPGGDTTASSSITSSALPSPGAGPRPHPSANQAAVLAPSHTAGSLHSTEGTNASAAPHTPPSPAVLPTADALASTAPPTPLIPMNAPIPHSPPTLPLLVGEVVVGDTHDDAEAEREAYEEHKATALRLMASFIPLYRGKAAVTCVPPPPHTHSAFDSTDLEEDGEEDVSGGSRYAILSPEEWKAVRETEHKVGVGSAAAVDKKFTASPDNGRGTLLPTHNVSVFPPPHYIEMIVLEDVCHGFQFPCVLDMKMGKRQYGLRATEKKKNSKTMKANLSTSAKYGIRLAGYRKYDVASEEYVSKGKIDCRYLTLHELHQELIFFLGHNRSLDIRFCQQVERLRSAFSQQRVFRFFTSSLLFVYDAAKPVETARVVMIDFAFTYERRELLDEKDEDAPFEFDLGYLRALDTLLSLLA